MKKYMLFLFIINILLSCNNSSDKFDELIKENQQLKEEIQTLKKNVDEYKFMPILYPKASRIKVGENYEALFYIGVYSNKRPPKIIVYNHENPGFKDTLLYNKDVRGCLFNFKPTKKGHYVFFAHMEIPTIQDTVSFPIKWEFDVK